MGHGGLLYLGENTMEKACKYPIVFVHGLFGWGEDEGLDRKMPYWGATTGSLTAYLESLGQECYCASVGPISSVWDRACELYARLTGTRVDYGKAHSAWAKHRRYGRTYTEPLIPEWNAEKKIHLVGHSFGGNTIRLLAHLLRCGDPREQAVTDRAELSDLFTGGKEDLICSIVTICAPHDGTFAFDASKKYKILPMLQFLTYNYAALVGRSAAVDKSFVDFHLEQYGLSNTPGLKDSEPVLQAKRQYTQNKDNAEFDLSDEGASKLNALIEICPHIYYFSYAFNAVVQSETGKRESAKTNFPLLKCTSYLMRRYNSQMRENPDDPRNDGLVHVASALHPCDEPWIQFDGQIHGSGIWHVMDVRRGDHGTPIGLFADKDKTHELYLEILDLLRRSESLCNAAEFPAQP